MSEQQLKSKAELFLGKKLYAYFPLFLPRGQVFYKS
jgi:hypothetical protein